MAEEHLYSISGAKATSARRVSLTEAGLLERDHLQEWVIEHPEILGEDLLIVTFEFDRWLTGGGSPTWERLDVLALDQSGRLVVAELKRDKAPDSVMVQALNYAAMVRGFNLDTLGEAFAARKGAGMTPAEALDEMRDWAPSLSDETLGPPRIVLVAEEFSPVMTNTAMYLIEQSLELRLVRVLLYDLGDRDFVMTASQLLPVPNVEEFMVRPRSTAETQRASRVAAVRRASVPARLVTADALADGEPLTIAVPSGAAEDRESIAAWLAEDDRRAQAVWRNDPQMPVTWVFDQAAWNLTALIRKVVEEATGVPARTQLWGPNWFRTKDGTVLYKLADAVDPGESSRRFDWDRLHRLLERVPAGRWTTYGDLATAIGTAPQPVGNHVASCPDCPNPWRVLGADARSRPTFGWSDPEDSRSQEDVLASEGVRFVDGVAEKQMRLPSAELG